MEQKTSFSTCQLQQVPVNSAIFISSQPAEARQSNHTNRKLMGLEPSRLHSDPGTWQTWYQFCVLPTTLQVPFTWSVKNYMTGCGAQPAQMMQNRNHF